MQNSDFFFIVRMAGAVHEVYPEEELLANTHSTSSRAAKTYHVGDRDRSRSSMISGSSVDVRAASLVCFGCRNVSVGSGPRLNNGDGGKNPSKKPSKDSSSFRDRRYPFTSLAKQRVRLHTLPAKCDHVSRMSSLRQRPPTILGQELHL